MNGHSFLNISNNWLLHIATHLFTKSVSGRSAKFTTGDFECMVCLKKSTLKKIGGPWECSMGFKAAVCIRRSSSGDLRWQRCRGCYPCKWMYLVSLRQSSPVNIAGHVDHRRGLPTKQIPGDLRRRFMSSSNSTPW